MRLLFVKAGFRPGSPPSAAPKPTKLPLRPLSSCTSRIFGCTDHLLHSHQSRAPSPSPSSSLSMTVFPRTLLNTRPASSPSNPSGVPQPSNVHGTPDTHAKGSASQPPPLDHGHGVRACPPLLFLCCHDSVAPPRFFCGAAGTGTMDGPLEEPSLPPFPDRGTGACIPCGAGEEIPNAISVSTYQGEGVTANNDTRRGLTKKMAWNAVLAEA